MGSGPAGGYNVGDAFNWGWQKFQQNLGPILIGMVAYFVATLIIGFVWWLIVSAIVGFGDANTGFFALLILAGLGGLVYAALGFIIQAAVTRASLKIANGEQIDLQVLLSTDHLPQILLTALLVGVISGIGYILCYLPGIIAIFFLQFAMLFVIDQRMEAMDALRASFQFVQQNLGQLVGFSVLAAVALFIGGLLCGVGTLVAFPVVVLAQVFTYRRLQGQTVAA